MLRLAKARGFVVLGLLISSFSLPVAGIAQVAAQSTPADSAVAAQQPLPSGEMSLPDFYRLHPGMNTEGNTIFAMQNAFEQTGQDFWFYWLAATLLVVGILRIMYPIYFKDMFRIFRKSALQQVALRERLSANTFPGFMLNFLFVINFGTFLFLILKQKDLLIPADAWWQQWLLFPLILAIVYLIKYLFNYLAGWAFNQPAFFSNYLFVVFLINKILAIVVLPFIAVLLFANENIQSVFWILGLFTVGMIFLLRYLSGLRMAGKQLKLTPFHFFIYLCAFEIVPVMVLLKWAIAHIVPA